MLMPRSSAGDGEGEGRRTRWALCLGLTACFSFGCPGAEPSAAGSGGAGAGGAPASTSKSSSGQGGEGEGGGSVSSSSGTGGNNEGGCAADASSDPENCGECGRVCRKDGRVEQARCVDGRCESFCKSGFVNIDTPETGEDDGCEQLGRRVFVTDAVFSVPQIGGVSGADARCQTLAVLHNLGGNWRAWLSGSNPNGASVADRFVRDPEAPYMLLDFTQVAASWDDLTTPLDHPIDLTEAMTTVAGNSRFVWTGTTPDGTATGFDCGSWGNAQTFEEGTVGDATQVTSEWTQGTTEGIVPCTAQARLYCFEQ